MGMKRCRADLAYSCCSISHGAVGLAPFHKHGTGPGPALVYAPPCATLVNMDEVRLDQWLCAARLYKSRTLAQKGCGAGHVKVNDLVAKSSRCVRVGAAAGAEEGRGRGRIEPRFGIDQKPARRDDLVAGRHALEHRVKVILPRSELDLHALEFTLLPLDINHLLRPVSTTACSGTTRNSCCGWVEPSFCLTRSTCPALAASDL